MNEKGYIGYQEVSRESERKYNPNNEGIVSVFRHGDKAGEELAPEGFAQAREIGERTERIGKIGKGYGSPMKRTQDMAGEMLKTLVGKEIEDPLTGEKLTGEQYKLRVREGLSFLERGKKARWFSENWANLAKEHPDKPLEVYLAFGEKRPDETTISPKEMASRVAKVLLLQIRMIGRLESGSRVNLADGSHTPVLDVFIAEALKDQIEKDPVNPEGKTLVEKMGGAFKTADGFEIRVKTDEEGKLSVDLSFRGKTYKIDLEELRNLAKFYQEKKEKEEEPVENKG